MTLKKRSQARVLAVQALCLFDALGTDFEQRLSAFLHDPLAYADLELESAPDAATIAFARELALGTRQGQVRYDELLEQSVPDWSIARMPPVDRNILRLGLHELLEHPETPPEVIINEAIELARLLGAEDSTSFVNAVLDANRRRLGIGTPPADPP
jgi:N utilization substance protein B